MDFLLLVTGLMVFFVLVLDSWQVNQKLRGILAALERIESLLDERDRTKKDAQ